jgi:hypothetical protein
MKPSLAVLLLPLAASVTHADFVIYSTHRFNHQCSGCSPKDNFWTFYPNFGGCGQLDYNDWFRLKGDVSGSKLGVRCKGSKDACEGYGHAKGIQELEFHTKNSPKRHYSKYMCPPFVSARGVFRKIVRADV